MANQPLYTEEELVQAVRERDKTAFESLYTSYSGMVYGLVLRILNDEEHAREVLQDTFMKVWLNIESYSPAKGRLSTWIMNIARNRAIDETRTKSFRQTAANRELDNSVYEINRSATVNTSTDGIGVKSYTGFLRPEQQRLVELVYFRGYTHEEAAKELNIPLGTVKTRIRTSLEALRKLLKVDK